jgi:hypothetical protein
LLTVLDALTQRWRRLPAVGAALTCVDRLQRHALAQFAKHANEALEVLIARKWILRIISHDDANVSPIFICLS